jgi:hypothetical protein
MHVGIGKYRYDSGTGGFASDLDFSTSQFSMPLLNARWITFFAAWTPSLITLVGVVGWASF